MTTSQPPKRHPKSTTLSSKAIHLRTSTILYQPLADAVKAASDSMNNTLPLYEKDLLPWINDQATLSRKTAGIISLIVRSCLLRDAFKIGKHPPDEDLFQELTLKALESLKTHLKPTGNPDFDHKNLVVVSVFYAIKGFATKNKVSLDYIAEYADIATNDVYNDDVEYENQLFGKKVDVFNGLFSKLTLGSSNPDYGRYLVDSIGGETVRATSSMCQYAKRKYGVDNDTLRADLVKVAEVIATVRKEG